MIKYLIVPIVFIVSYLNTSLIANDNTAKDDKKLMPTEKHESLRVYVEGDFVGDVRRALNFVTLVNRADVADVHVIVKSMTNGGGGNTYAFNFYNENFPNIGNSVLTCSTYGGETNYEIRDKLSKTLISGLLPYLNETKDYERFKLKIRYDKDNSTPVPIIQDAWNYWVFSTDISGDGDLEESKTNYSYQFRMRADRVTENWRIRNQLNINDRFRETKKNNESFIANNNFRSLNSSVVYSISDH